MSSSPAGGDTLTIPPAAVTLVFDEELGADGSGFTVTGPDGAVVGAGGLDLTVADRNELHGAVEISKPGAYTVAWTAAAADAHPVTGEFVFTLAGDESPDTALPARADGSTALGWILVLLALGIGLRRVREVVS